MTIAERPQAAPQLESMFANKEELQEIVAQEIVAQEIVAQEIVAQQFDAMGWEYDPTATADDSCQAMLAEGIRPEDNSLSPAIVAARAASRESSSTTSTRRMPPCR